MTFGMANRGNTCFFNSVMQCLAHTVPLHQFCTSDSSHSKFCQNNRCLLCTYSKYLKAADQTGRTNTKLIEPFMRKIMPTY
mmetsp:Transcript_10347/g.15889  ORF Transcript_10347/g.15889 Transcript_10347/m.15889 type:complete len:81 (+) Transcript_10347:252-494(+)